MRKILPYLLLFYFLMLLSVILYRRLTPSAPPKPPSAWTMAWRTHGHILAYVTMIMLAMMEIGLGLLLLGGVLVLLKKGWTIWANSVGRSGGLAPVMQERGNGTTPIPTGRSSPRPLPRTRPR